MERRFAILYTSATDIVERRCLVIKVRLGGPTTHARIQIFDRSGRFLREWKLGHPFGLFVTPDHFIYMADAIASRILKIDQDGKIVGVLSGPEPGEGRHFDPHEIAVDKDNSIFTAEVMPWRAQKFRPK